MKIAISSFFLDASGYGQAARRLLRALLAVGAEVSPSQALDDGGPKVAPEPWLQDFLGIPAVDLPDVHLIAAAAGDFPILTAPAKRTVGWTCVETDRAHPAFVAGCAGMDLVIVPSEHTRRALLAGGLDVPVKIVPVPALEPPDVTPADLGLPESVFLFYSVLTWYERKNPEGLLVAYLTTFTGYDDVALVLKVPAAAKAIAVRRFHDLREAVNLPNPPAVRMLVAHQDDGAVWALHRRGDAYVTLTRGEAAGIPIIDARAVGNPVIVPDWGGHLDYLDLGPNSMQIRVPTRLAPAVQHYRYFDGSQRWADPDVIEAGRAMRTVFEAGRLRKPSIPERLRLPAVGRALLEALSGD